MKEIEKKDNKTCLTKEEQEKINKIKIKNKQSQIKRLKDKYFDLYDDIKISDRQDW